MKSPVVLFLTILTTFTLGCASKLNAQPSDDEARKWKGEWTLYRTGHVLIYVRDHFATFDSEDGGVGNVLGRSCINETNCRLTARALNIIAVLEFEDWAKRGGGFWCEVGTYRESGMPGDQVKKHLNLETGDTDPLSCSEERDLDPDDVEQLRKLFQRLSPENSN